MPRVKRSGSPIARPLMVLNTWSCFMTVTTPRTRPPGPLATELATLTDTLARCQWRIVCASADFADSHEWASAGSPTAAHYLADLADIEVCTAREWIRVGRRLRELPATADAFASRRISYAKARALTRFATPDNELELLAIADRTPAGDLNRALAAWLRDSSSPEELDEWHRRRRSVTWRTEPDGMVTFTLRLPPHIAAVLISILTALVMRMRPAADASGSYPTSAQQQADALHHLLTAGVGTTTTEVIFHVRGDGCAADDGTPVTETAIASLIDEARLRAMIHDADGRPINASAAQRHPTTRQKRVVKERDRACVDCGRTDLLEYDHVPAYEETGHTVVDELRLRCAPCHHRRHETAA